MRTVRQNPRSSRLRTLALVALAVLFALFLFGSGIAQLYTDWLWFSNLGFGSVWSSILGTQLTIVAIATFVFFIVVWVNLYLADRFAPEFRPSGPEDELVERYHELADPYAAKIRFGAAALVAVVAGTGKAHHWETWMLFRNGSDFGRTDPLFGKDAAFYVFQLPFWTALVDFLFLSLSFGLIVSLVAHYLNGGIRAVGSGDSSRVSSLVKLHMSVLLASLALVRAVAYYLDRFQLVNADRGVYDGALATDVEVQLPALNLLTLISVIGAGLFIFNIWRQGWGLPVVAVGLWAVSHVIVGGMVPGLFQRLRVEPQESEREAQYIGDNIAATRFAYGLDDANLSIQDFGYTGSLTAADVADNADIIDDVALIDPGLLAETFVKEQGERDTYEFPDELDVDRYLVDGDLEPVVVAVRNLAPEAKQGWENRHLVFTHGYGLAMAEGDSSPLESPAYLVSGIGPGLAVDEGLAQGFDTPQVYFSEDLSGYALVNTSREEEDYVGSGEIGYSYSGTGGVPMGSIIRRTAFALRFQDMNLLISGFIQGDSEAIYIRDVEDRVRELAPFLSFDSDPYPVLADGRVVWVVDAYTTTNDYPYSQKVSTDSIDADDDLHDGYNYVRNSVKAVVDSYDGTVDFFVVDEEDPIIGAYQASFPDLFRPMAEMPDSIASHIRYPSDIFQAQTDMWANYQIDDPREFLEGALRWKVASQPSATTDDNSNAAPVPMDPQYRTTRLPGETESEFIVQRGFVPSSSETGGGRPELTSILVARSDPGHYGELIQYNLDGLVDAPDLIDAAINKDSDISEFITLRADLGSEIQFGEMQMVLVGETLLYVRPLYIGATSENAVPELSRVIAVNGDRVAMATTLDDAVAGVLSEAAPVETPDDPAEPSEPGEIPDVGDLTLTDLLAQAQELSALAQEYLDLAELREADGDPEAAADLRAQATEALEQLDALFGFQSSPPPTDSGGA